MGWLNAIIAIVTIILYFLYRSYKSNSEDLQRQLNESRRNVTNLETELDDCKIRIFYCSDIVTKIQESNNKLLAEMSKAEDNCECNINYSEPLTAYYNEQNKMLQELIDNKPPSDLLEEKSKILGMSYSTRLRTEEERHIAQIKLAEENHRTQMRIAENRHQSEINILTERYKHLDKLQSNLTAIPYMAGIVADYETYGLEVLAKKLDWGYSYERSKKVETIREIRSEAKELAEKNLVAKYQLRYLLELFPSLKAVLLTDYQELNKNPYESILKEPIDQYINSFLESTKSNLSAIPYMSAIMADFETYELELLARKLNWGCNVERAKKVASIRDIRKAAKEMAERNLEAKYQLQYLLELFPNLQDVIETDYKQLPLVKIEDLSDYDAARDWLSKEEYQSLSTVERNQLALDRYKESHNKTKWQIGRDYELYVGYTYQQKGYTVDYFGSYMGLEDLGRDLIAKKDSKTLIIQCKYWSHEKVIHEKHITQLYGTMASYIIEQGVPTKNVTGIIVTNIKLSEQAKKMADYLKIRYVEDFEKGDYPCIKCNIGSDEYGKTYIYHLPFDQQYDSTKIDAPGEFFAMTVKEAEDKGFRRAFKWFGS